MNHSIVEKEKQLILNEIEEKKWDLIMFLQQLVSVPSDNPPGNCKAIAEFTKSKLEQLGFRDSKLYEVPGADANRIGMEYAANVVAYEEFNSLDGPEITLNSHGDVVPPGTGWTVDPYGGEVKDNSLFGRGAAVSKSDIASFTYAVLALRKVSDKLKGKLSLAFTFDEETGGELGPKWLLEHQLIQPDLAICPGFSHSIINAHNGCLHLEVKIKGKLAHAAEPFHGIDALEAMTDVLQALYTYRRVLAHKKSAIEGIESPTMVIGLISGGINTNVVPDKCTIRIDRRLIPEEDPKLVEDEIRNLIELNVQSHNGIEVEISNVLLAKSFGPVEKNSSLIQSFVNNAKLLYNEELPVHGSPLYTDARHFYEADIPVILFGAGPKTLLEANGHRADEHVKIEDLVRATKIVALSLYDLLKK
jgi:acetylornithine deacetylase/succinyl-diaminopimelate desuccinylase family protein